MGRARLAGSLVLLAAMLASAGADASEVLDRAQERGHLVAAALPDALPQSGRDAAGNLAGFDIAVSEALGKQLGSTVEFALPTWQDILDGGWQGRWDYAVVSMTPTPEREQTLAFPAVYRLLAGRSRRPRGQHRRSRSPRTSPARPSASSRTRPSSST